MATVVIHPASSQRGLALANPLPKLLHTPSGLAILELQGTINLPYVDEEDIECGGGAQTKIGRLIFPDYSGHNGDDGSTAWMKRVYLYVGEHQRLTGEVKKLPKAIAIIRKIKADGGASGGVDENGNIPEELEVVEIVKHKIIFSSRPEPVGTWAAGGD